MCGITGIINLNKQQDVHESLLKSMTDTLTHRGPDSSGIFVHENKQVGLGFRRLAIIDLSDAGNQPMKSRCSQNWIVFNGEIYNFKQLRTELKEKHDFFSQTDTEVLLHLYEEKGEKMVEDLNGMFAFCLWDEQKKIFFCARDQSGIKPFYYYFDGSRFIFGSEIKALLQHPGVKREIYFPAVSYYVTFACVPSPHTLFKNISKLEAAHCLIVSNEGIKKWEYWNPLDGYLEKKDEEFFIEETRNLLEDSIKSQMISDVPFGCFLSGGVDSSTNAVLMSRALGTPVKTFSIGFREYPKYNEFEYSRKIVKMLGAQSFETLIGEEELTEFLPQLAWHADDPNGDPVCFPVYYLSKLIRDSGVIMAQVGEGADELFAGYNHYLLMVTLWKRYLRILERFPLTIRKAFFELSTYVKKPRLESEREMLRRLSSQQELFWGGAIAFTDLQKKTLFSKSFQKELADFPSYTIIEKYYKEIDQRIPDADFLTRMIYLELKIRLPELLLMRVDKMASANSIEARVPFLDTKLIQLALQIPMQLKLKNNETKYLLKKAVETILPYEIIYRKKQGFGSPVEELLRKQKWNSYFRNLIFTSFFVSEGYFNKEYIESLFQYPERHSFRIWNLVTLTLWHQEWM